MVLGKEARKKRKKIKQITNAIRLRSNWKGVLSRFDSLSKKDIVDYSNKKHGMSGDLDKPVNQIIREIIIAKKAVSPVSKIKGMLNQAGKLAKQIAEKRFGISGQVKLPIVYDVRFDADELVNIKNAIILLPSIPIEPVSLNARTVAELYFELKNMNSFIANTGFIPIITVEEDSKLYIIIGPNYMFSATKVLKRVIPKRAVQYSNDAAFFSVFSLVLFSIMSSNLSLRQDREGWDALFPLDMLNLAMLIALYLPEMNLSGKVQEILLASFTSENPTLKLMHTLLLAKYNSEPGKMCDIIRGIFQEFGSNPEVTKIVLKLGDNLKKTSELLDRLAEILEID